MAFGATGRAGTAQASRRRPAPRCCRRIAAASSSPGDDEIGWTARRGRVPLGYLGDRKKTEETFPIIDGERVAVPGRPGAARRPTGRSCCSGATRWW